MKTLQQLFDGMGEKTISNEQYAIRRALKLVKELRVKNVYYRERKQRIINILESVVE